MNNLGGKSQRKGRAGELELAHILNEYGYNVEAGRALNFGQEPDLKGLKNIHAEVKRVERLNLLEAMKQAEEDSKRFADGLPAVFHRKNRSPWLVTMFLADWIKIYKKFSGQEAADDDSGDSGTG